MSKISRRERILLGVFLVVLLTYLANQQWYTPFAVHKQELIDLRDHLQIQWQGMEGSVGNQSELKAKLSQISTETARLTQQKVSSNQTSNFFQAINTTAKQSNVSIEQIQTTVDMTHTLSTNTNTNVNANSNTNANRNANSNTNGTANTNRTTQASQPSAVQVTIQGDYASVVNFLNKMKQIPYAFVIQQGGMQFKENQVIISLVVAFPS